MRNFSVPGFWKARRAILLEGLEGGVLILVFAWLYYDSAFAIPFLSPLLLFWIRECEKSRKKKEDERFKRMFREWILLLSSSLSAGYSVENAMEQSCRELRLMFPLGGPMTDELREMLIRARNNQRPEELLSDLAKRHPFDEVRSFVEVFCTARGSGGSLNAVIRSTAAQMAEIMDTSREIETMLAAKVFEQKIMTVMPAVILLYVRIGSGEFLRGLYHNPAGIVVMTFCLGIYLAAYLIGKRMVQFEI